MVNCKKVRFKNEADFFWQDEIYELDILMFSIHFMHVIWYIDDNNSMQAF